MMKSIGTYIDTSLVSVVDFLITCYQKTLSPDKGLFSPWLKGRICIHIPHCSAYGRQCFQRYGFITGLHYTMERISKCIPSHTPIHDPSHYKVVFFSSAAIGISFLEEIHQDPRFDVTGVVTMPDAPSGRGMHIKENVIKKKAKEIGLTDDNIMTPRSLKLDSKKYAHEAEAVAAWLQQQTPDYIVVIAYGKIIPQHILNVPYIDPINVHGSLLPKYRGASPLQSVFLNNETETGITIMRMAATLDTGDSIRTYSFLLPLARTTKELIHHLQDKGPNFLTETLWKYGKGEIEATPQDHTQATYCTKITKEDGYIEIYNTLQTIYNKYKAYALWPKIYFIHHEKRIIIERIGIDEKLYAIHHDKPCIHTDATLNPSITEFIVKPEGKKSMSRDAFMKGYM